MTISTLNKCYQFSGVRFEFDAMQLVWDNGVVTPLTRQEAHLLDILCYNGGEVISYSILTNTLLAIHIEGKIIPISALIARINAKLGQFGDLQIHHIEDFGYRISPSDRHTSNPAPKISATKESTLPAVTNPLDSKLRRSRRGPKSSKIVMAFILLLII
ncbi:helix-turn-helix domain-containing protein [Thaumasiovibrio subtropicus]|uniref:helix-turn-helix domain-containing protein n=1 Tax=Thaumasiovibrio subtropicus TaxID=1891207 RepID=UPI000B35A8B7|nr:helix-turn-helix domain-containing protein [Thaumasiovibrio subtropicus]